MKLWDATSGRELLLLARHGGPAWRVAFDADGRRLASCGADGLVQVWDTPSAAEVLLQRDYAERITALAATPDGSTLAVAVHKQVDPSERLIGRNAASDVGVWDVAARREVRRLACRFDYPRVAFSEDGRLLIAADAGGETQSWQVATGAEVASSGPPPGAPSVVAPLPALGLRAVATWRDVRLYDAVPSAEELAMRRAQSAPDPAWHAVQAQDAEKVGDPFAAAFHRSRASVRRAD